MTTLTPQEIVKELDKFIIGQDAAKRSIAIAIRNRWRRSKLSKELQEDIIPKNMMMIGPTGCGKTEIARRTAKLIEVPFIKVEATKFTEVGYVGRDVESIIRDLLDIAIRLHSDRIKETLKNQAVEASYQRVLDAVVGNSAREQTRQTYLERIRCGALDNQMIDIELQESKKSPLSNMFDFPGMPAGAQVGVMNLGDMLQKSMGGESRKKRSIELGKALDLVIEEELELLVDDDLIAKEALEITENNGIVFIDEIDKICEMSERRGGDVSRSGVQRDLLPLIEGTTVQTRHGSIRTDHILFITSGAFHKSKPSDLLPELQGRLPVRVSLEPLGKQDLIRILTETTHNLPMQYQSLLSVEGISLHFEDAAIDTIGEIAAEINDNIENIGARRLHAVIEKILEEVSFEATAREENTFTVTKEYVEAQLEAMRETSDLSRFML